MAVWAKTECFKFFRFSCAVHSRAWAEMELIMAKLLFNFDFEIADREMEDWTDQKVFLLFERLPLLVRLHARALS